MYQFIAIRESSASFDFAFLPDHFFDASNLPLPNQILYIYSNFRKQLCMFSRSTQTLLIFGASHIHLSSLLQEQHIELVNLFLGPFNAGRLHQWREAALVDIDRVANQREYDVRNLVEVLTKIALVDALTVLA